MINNGHLVDIQPITENQKRLCESYSAGKNIIAYGAAGTGKTFITLYNAIKEVLNAETPYKKVYIVRSLTATRETGIVSSNHEEQSWLYQVPYQSMVKYMFQMSSDQEFNNLYRNLKNQGTINFLSTSYIRGTTLDDAIVIVDEFENLNFHELDSIITRVGQNSKIHFCGDATQSDLEQTTERNGIVDFIKVTRGMPSVDIIEFGIDDIVRSGIVKEYLIAKLEQSM
jgi:predicted ribonuclease YlaK